jgi:hypothetical protein
MSGLAEGNYGFVQAGRQVSPADIDIAQQFIITNPSLSVSAIGTVSSAATAAFVLDNIRPDYPRTLAISILGVAGGMGGTVTVNGYDQFGGTQTETIGFASAAGGGTVATTKVFGRVVSAVTTGLAGLGGTAIGTARIGYEFGTATGRVAKFGLPTKIAAVSDVRRITYTSQGVGGTALNGGTIDSTNVDVTNSAFIPNRILAGTEVYTIAIKSTFDNSGKPNMSLAS